MKILTEYSDKQLRKTLKKSLLKLLPQLETMPCPQSREYVLPVSTFAEELKVLIDEEFSANSIVVNNRIFTRFEFGEDFTILIEKCKQNPAYEI